MAWIEWVEEEKAEGLVAEVYKSWLAANPHRDRMPEILKCFSSSPRVLKGLMEFCYPLQFQEGALSRRQKELIATYVSALNHCPY